MNTAGSGEENEERFRGVLFQPSSLVIYSPQNKKPRFLSLFSYFPPSWNSRSKLPASCSVSRHCRDACCGRFHLLFIYLFILLNKQTTLLTFLTNKSRCPGAVQIVPLHYSGRFIQNIHFPTMLLLAIIVGLPRIPVPECQTGSINPEPN